jgi:MFS family permease
MLAQASLAVSAVVSNVRHPIWLPATAAQPGAWAFAILYSVESLSRASIASVVPIQAYDLLKDEQEVSLLFFAIAAAGIAATLLAPPLFQRIPRRFVYTGGGLILVAASVALATHTLAGQAIGMFCRVFGASTLSIMLNLYIMEFIPRQQLVRSESLRLTLSTASWTVGPGLGAWLYVDFGHVAPFLWSGVWAMILIAIFWFFRLSPNPAISPGPLKPVKPLAGIARFLAQPRMRLAWLIAFGRSCYWNTFFIYAPILLVATGEGKLAGGLVVSGGNALLLSAILWGRAGGRFGVRKVIVLAFVATAAAAVLAGLAGVQHPWLAAAMMLGGVVFAVALDALGSTPFLRSVHVYERPQMTAVYRTYLDMSELLPPFIYAIILGFTGLGGVFVALGLFCVFCGWVAWRHLPRSM